MNNGWVLITGASSGIGYALAVEFAQKNYHVVGVGRDQQRLKELESELKKKNTNIQVRTLSLDLSLPLAVNDLLAYLDQQQIQVDILVNNAGSGLHGEFVDTDINVEFTMVDLHIKSYLALSKVILKQMLQRKQGKIVNISSIYAAIPVPRQSVYAATKSFMELHSLALRGELKQTPIEVYLVYPGSVSTGFLQNIRPAHASRFTAEATAQEIMNGITHKKLIIIPGFANKVAYAMRWLPKGILIRFIDWYNKKRGL
jgi:short-subunit dehydrogenase